MNIRTTSYLLAAVGITAASLVARPAAADPREDYVNALNDYTGDWTRPTVLAKLVTLKVGKKCLAKLADKANDGVNSAAGFTLSVSNYAKRVGGGDWSATETQSVNTKEENKQMAVKMIDDFKSKFSFTLVSDGDDCDASANSLMLHLWTTVGIALDRFDPKAGKVAITLNMSSKSKDVTTSTSGANITINASSKIAVPGSEDKIQTTFKHMSK